MTTDDTTTPPAEVEDRPQEPADGLEEPPGEQEPGGQEPDGTDPLSAARREAAGYRRRLRETEAERDAARTTLDVYRRREVEQMAEAGVGGFGASGMQSGADLWVAGVQLSDLLSEDGTVDAEKTKAAVLAVLAARPHWRRPAVDVGLGPRMSTPTGRSFADVLREGAR